MYTHLERERDNIRNALFSARSTSTIPQKRAHDGLTRLAVPQAVEGQADGYQRRDEALMGLGEFFFNQCVPIFPLGLVLIFKQTMNLAGLLQTAYMHQIPTQTAALMLMDHGTPLSMNLARSRGSQTTTSLLKTLADLDLDRTRWSLLYLPRAWTSIQMDYTMIQGKPPPLLTTRTS